MLPVRDLSGRRVAVWALLNSVALVVVSLLPLWYGLASRAYGLAAGLLGAWFVWRAVEFLRPAARDQAARKLFLASIAYLPLVLGALVADRLINA
jgi:protoheme IX farnesyltransferase